MTTKLRYSYQLHIQLCDIKPAIWRRILVADNTTLAQLHRTVQAAMGWENCHAYALEIAGQRYGIPDPDWPDDPTMDARRYTLAQLLQGQALAIRYLYDFGDGWMHRIKLEAVSPIDAFQAQQLPQCVAGRNACPPEDCGGVPGFADFVAAIADKTHPLHKAARKLHRAAYDPKHFDVSMAQARMDALQLPRAGASHKAIARQPEAAFA